MPAYMRQAGRELNPARPQTGGLTTFAIREVFLKRKILEAISKMIMIKFFNIPDRK